MRFSLSVTLTCVFWLYFGADIRLYCSADIYQLNLDKFFVFFHRLSISLSRLSVLVLADFSALIRGQVSVGAQNAKITT